MQRVFKKNVYSIPAPSKLAQLGNYQHSSGVQSSQHALFVNLEQV